VDAPRLLGLEAEDDDAFRFPVWPLFGRLPLGTRDDIAVLLLIRIALYLAPVMELLIEHRKNGGQ